MRRTKGISSQLKQDINEGPEPEPEETPDGFIPTGSTLLNLALSNRHDGGWQLGKFSNLIGDSSSGKTLLALTAFAEMARSARFNEYRLIYDDAEAANEFDLTRLFGQSTAERIEPPARDGEGEPLHSNTIQDFQCNLEAALEDGRHFLYVLDSFDALTSEEEVGRMAAQRKARNEGKETSGTYGMEKAKAASQLFRMVKARLKGTASVLIVISQTRDNIDPMSFTKKTRSGGRALDFYATHILWTAVGGQLSKTVAGKPHPVGVRSLVRVSKNKLTGRLSKIELPLLYDYGVDDHSSMLRYLVEYGKAEKAKGGQMTVEGETGGEAALLAKMDQNRLYTRRVRRRVAITWREVDEALKTDRRRKYE